MQGLTEHRKKLLRWGISIAIIIGLVFFFWPGHPPYKFLMKTLGIESSLQGTQEQSSERDDFGCFYSCKYFPEGFPRQMCEDWKAGKQVQWPPDCSMMQYGPCIKLCEAEKKRTVLVGKQKQAFNVLPSFVKAEFANDVNEEDKGFVITGISAMDFYLRKWFGKSINQPAGLRVDATENTGAQVVIENGKAIILIGTRAWDWKGMIEVNKYGGEWRPRLPAHEYVHVYQFHNGCGRLDVETLIVPRWFAEGEAEWLSYKAMQEVGLIPSVGIPQMLIPGAKQETGLLKSFEGKDFSKGDMPISRYSLFNMAVDYLMKDKPIKALDDFCVNLADGKGMNMPKAFETAFGISLEKFYDDFESYRKTWSSKSSFGQDDDNYKGLGRDTNQNQQQQQLEIPAGVPASDPEAGSVYIYISDFDVGCIDKCEIFNFNYTNSRIMRIDDMTGKNWVSFGTIGKGVNQFRTPNHLTVGSDGKIYISDSQNDRIVRIDDMTGKGWITYGVSGRTGEPSTPSQVNLPPGEGRFIQPASVKFDSKGRIYIISGAELVRIDDMTGKGWTTFGSAGSGVNQFFKGKGLGIDSKNRIYIIDAGNHRIIRIDDMTGKGWITYGTKGSGIGQFEDELNGVTLDTQERIYISDEHNDRIVRIDDMTGKGWIEFGGLPNDKIGQPHDVSITKTGRIYILDTTHRRIVRIDDMTGKGWIAFAPDAKTEDARYFHKWHMSAPHGMFVVERN